MNYRDEVSRRPVRKMDIEEAIRRAEWCFTEGSYPNISNAFRLACLPDTISRIFEEHSNDGNIAGDSCPSSAKDLFSRASSVFSTSFVAHLELRFREFDILCGGPAADTFLSAGTYQTWTNTIADNAFRYYLATTSKEQHLEEPSRTSPESVSIPQFDAPFEAPAPIPISQIHLKGSTLKQAWAENNDLRQLFPFERLPLQSWTPSTPGGAPIFHGTSHHLQDARCQADLDSALASYPTRLVRAPGRTQLYPLSHGISGFCTSFSALRSFLWAVFMSEVIQDPPRPSRASSLQQTFHMRGEAFTGIILVEFHSNQPAPPGLDWYQIPNGREEEWSSIALSLGPYMSTTTNIWTDDLKAIHGQDTPKFPDIVHGKDLPPLQNSLRAFPCQRALLWQSAWMSEKAMVALNQRVSAIHAISFERTGPLAPEKKKKGSFSTMTRALGDQFKKMAEKKGRRS